MTTAIKRAFDDEDTIETTPDTSPDNAEAQGELVEAIEWLKSAGVVSAERQPFVGFFEELVGSESRSEKVVTELKGETRVVKASNDD